MPQHALTEYHTLVDQFAAHWKEYGETKEVAGRTLAEFQTLAQAALAKIETWTTLQERLSVAAAERDQAVEELEGAMIAYRDGVRGAAGRHSPAAESLPKASKGGRRPRRSSHPAPVA
ncbi:MAG: hypothetical protein COZ06_33520 [Armatimonadetes bacterium CG_4_10_14_3_um_filter_66_18]|nr:hypothetical protein [Armatimonadota bacterium]PIU87994.1 MAG: hypothetical protein COS65_31840 [Armatimonadetes bacterium CG06_land_8_20_14_3_00_66_21]PIX36908.1 MAG: hypothetical protein COZ57_37035 [Armatimonadetes bacterium CG_4_8_14_3_um_filter_66_20]PIY37118.1 MAG: hypothetical protein COZ06_33520 [Armatimonadetes bacterium CG_4_10_14_3_um_filter_66_18]PJB76319.1 MAG: hypothetical protein CO096_00395 [Armatimonadetes bacterium CG_4_9_14_3_um_filter_66_14]